MLKIRTNALSLVDENGEKHEIHAIGEDLTEIKEDLSQLSQLMPEAAPVVGKVLKVLAVNEDGSFVCEWADVDAGGGVEDVQSPDGTSWVQDGIASAPKAAEGVYGIAKLRGAYGIVAINDCLRINPLSPISNAKPYNNRKYYEHAIKMSQSDDVIRYILTDATAPTWTAEEQAAAQQRLGILSIEEVLF